MNPVISRVEERRTQLIDHNADLLRRAAALGRDELDDDAQADFDATTAEIEAADARLAQLRAAEERNAVAAALAIATDETLQRNGVRFESVGDRDDAWRRTFDLVAARATGEVELRDATLIGGIDDYIVSTRPVRGDYPRAVPRMLGLFEQQRMAGPTQRVYKVSATAKAGPTLEGAPKVDAELELVPQDVEAVKLTSVQKVTDELRGDWPSFAALVPAELLRGLAVAENDYVGGVLAAAVSPTPLDDLIDNIAEAIATVEDACGFTPDAIALGPADLALIRTAKADDAGTYVVNPTGAGPTTLHGVPLVVSSALDGDVYVGSFRTAGIGFTRQPPTVQVGYAGDDFVENKTTVRVETRVALGLVRPGHIVRLNDTGS